MDPNATLIALLEALEARRYGEAERHLMILTNWMANGGFAPNLAVAIEALRFARFEAGMKPLTSEELLKLVKDGE